MQNNDKILTENEPKNSKARIKANGKYLKNNYKRINIAVRPEQADRIKEIAKRFDLSLAQLIVDSVQLYNDTMCNCTSTGADTAQPEQDPTKSPIESAETTGAQPEEETEEETENEIGTEENQTAGAETTAGAEEEPQEDEDIPEELKAVRAAWARMGAFNEKITAERKRREAEERERRREITDEERYMMR